MKRTTAYRLLLFAALLHLFSDVAFVGGAILCVGPNEHRAIETEHLSTLGCQSNPAPSTSDYSSASPERGCSDSPLHGEAELVSSCDDASDFAPQAIAFSDAGLQLDRVVLQPSLRALSRAPDLPPELRAHRSTVLIL